MAYLLQKKKVSARNLAVDANASMQGQGTRRDSGLRPWDRPRRSVVSRLSQRAWRILASPLWNQSRAPDDLVLLPLRGAEAAREGAGAGDARRAT